MSVLTNEGCIALMSALPCRLRSPAESIELQMAYGSVVRCTANCVALQHRLGR